LACDGQVLPTAQYAALYQLITNTYGGQAASNTFALPNLQGAVAVSQGGNAGAMGASSFAPGPPAAFQTVCFAIAFEGMYPPIQSEEK
jgi:microcystin-dependent protein